MGSPFYPPGEDEIADKIDPPMKNLERFFTAPGENPHANQLPKHKKCVRIETYGKAA